MYKAIGIISGTIYGSGKTKRECHRLLDSNYPGTLKTIIYGSGRSQNLSVIYPEPLVITNREV